MASPGQSSNAISPGLPTEKSRTLNADIPRKISVRSLRNCVILEKLSKSRTPSNSGVSGYELVAFGSLDTELKCF